MRFSKKEEYLRQKDKKLKKIIDGNGHIYFKPDKKNQFDTLVGIVVSQFISTKAANSIFQNIIGVIVICFCLLLCYRSIIKVFIQ